MNKLSHLNTDQAVVFFAWSVLNKKVFFSPCSYFHVSVLPIFIAGPPECLAVQFWVLSLSLAYRDHARHTDNEIPKFFAVLCRNVSFYNVKHFFSTHSFKEHWNPVHFYLWETQPLRSALILLLIVLLATLNICFNILCLSFVPFVNLIYGDLQNITFCFLILYRITTFRETKSYLVINIVVRSLNASWNGSVLMRNT